MSRRRRRRRRRRRCQCCLVRERLLAPEVAHGLTLVAKQEALETLHLRIGVKNIVSEKRKEVSARKPFEKTSHHSTARVEGSSAHGRASLLLFAFLSYLFLLGVAHRPRSRVPFGLLSASRGSGGGKASCCWLLGARPFLLEVLPSTKSTSTRKRSEKWKGFALRSHSRKKKKTRPACQGWSLGVARALCSRCSSRCSSRRAQRAPRRARCSCRRKRLRLSLLFASCKEEATGGAISAISARSMLTIVALAATTTRASRHASLPSTTRPLNGEDTH